MSMHYLKAICVEDVPADQASNALAALEGTCANGADVITPFVMDGRCKGLDIGVWLSVTEVGQGVELDVALRASSRRIRYPWRSNTSPCTDPAKR